MKRKLILLCGIFLLTACTGKTDGNIPASNPPANIEDGVETDTVNQEQPAVKTIYGEISEVAGNSVTIKLMEQNNMAPGGQIMQKGEMPPSGSITLPDGTVVEWDEDNPLDMEQMRETMDAARNSEGEGGEMKFSAGEGAGGEMKFNAGDGMGDVTVSGANAGSSTAAGGAAGEGAPKNAVRMSRAYTGEEIEFIIPVGVPIMTMSRGESGVEETELELNKLKAGSIITVTYKEDGKIIDKILVVPASSGGGAPGGGMIDRDNLPANAQVTDFGDGRVMVTIPGPQ